MRIDALFRLSLYVTLTIATMTLGYALAELFPLIILFMVVVGGLLLAAYACEGRWWISSRTSDWVGLAIAVGLLVWMWDTFAHARVEWVNTTPVPAALLPFAGPLLMLLLIAMLFRPKTINDYWSVQLLGLMEVALACVLALDPLFAVFLICYLASTVWSLILLAKYRDALGTPPVIAPAKAGNSVKLGKIPAPKLVIQPSTKYGLGLTVRWTCLIVPLGIAIFILTPRLTDAEFNFTKLAKGIEHVETGFAPQLDLNHTGQMQVSTKVAFRAYVEDADGNPKIDITPEQRWRGLTLDLYRDGRWEGRRIHAPFRDQDSPAFLRSGKSKEDLPSLGPGQLFVSIGLDPNLTKELFLMEPVIVPRSDDRPPVVNVSKEAGVKGSWAPLFHSRDQTIVRSIGRKAPTHVEYMQVTRPLRQGELIPADDIDPDYLIRLMGWHRPKIQGVTNSLLKSLVERKILTEDDIATVSQTEILKKPQIPPGNRIKVARALETHLSKSGEFTYTLDLKRIDPKLDPVEDFLINIKEGHCEHFATALVAMLRCAGVPARMVNGFLGAEKGSKPGWYNINESHAHAWVEALVGKPGLSNWNDLYWLRLDPSPVEVEDTAEAGWSFERWWEHTKSLGRAYWRSVFIEGTTDLIYDPSSFWENLATPFREASGTTEGGSSFVVIVLAFLGGLGALVGLGFLIRRFRRRATTVTTVQTPRFEVAFYKRFLALLGKHFDLNPRASQTPLEFGHTVRKIWLGAAAMARFADMPIIIIRHFYRVRFGGETLGSAEHKEIDAQLNELEKQGLGTGA
jgi:hypothetical protein